MNTAGIFISNLVETPIYYGILALFLSIYGPRLHPKLPPVIKDLFNNSVTMEWWHLLLLLLLPLVSRRRA